MGGRTGQSSGASVQGSFVVIADSWQRFVRWYAADLSHGRLFVPTEDAVADGSLVQLKLRLPEGHEAPLTARVLERIDQTHPRVSERGCGLLVELLHLDEARERQLRQLVEFACNTATSDAPGATFASHMFRVSPSIPPAAVLDSLPPRGSMQRSGHSSGVATPRTRSGTRLSPSSSSGTSDPDQLKVGLRHVAHKRYADALKVFAAMIRKDPRDTEAHKWTQLTLARQHLAAGDEDAALASYRAALQYDPEHQEAVRFVSDVEHRRKLAAIPFGRFFLKAK